MNTAVAIIRLIMAELGKTTPIFTAALGLSNPAETSIFRWGDGSSLNEGEVDVAYIGIGAWKK